MERLELQRPRTHRPACGRARGFTLLELLAIILLLGIVSAVAYSRIPGDDLAVATQAERLAAAIRGVQSLAMTQGQRYQITLSATGYDVQSLSAGVASPAREPGGSGQTGPFTLDAAVTVAVPAGLPNSLIAFDGRGTPYVDSASPGTALAAAAGITVSKNGISRNVVVAPETGHVDVQ
jgi:prepilin-type N-terminal cleavage/methylation domain-containing protein